MLFQKTFKMVVETAVNIECTKCPCQTKTLSEMTNHHLKTHALETAKRIFESQVSKLMSKENLMDSYGFDAGSLKEIFTDKIEKRSFHVVQVLALNPDFIHISDGSCIVTNCIATCDVTEIRRASTYCVIKMNKWSVIQIVPKKEPGQRKKQPEYGINIESFEVLESQRTLPMLGLLWVPCLVNLGRLLPLCRWCLHCAQEKIWTVRSVEQVRQGLNRKPLENCKLPLKLYSIIMSFERLGLLSTLTLHRTLHSMSVGSSL